jgi:hypothetical protein
MALIKCPECKKNVSDKAIACPDCGYPIGEYAAKPWASLNCRGECFSDSTGRVWRMLGKDIYARRMLVISEEIVEMRAYHSEPVNVTWEKCDLRRYLNSSFFEKLPIGLKDNVVETFLDNEALQWNGSSWKEVYGNPTHDKTFLLRWKEYKFYFDRGSMGIARYDYSKEWWWPRSPHTWDGSESVAAHRSAYECHEFANKIGGVRPALVLNL